MDKVNVREKLDRFSPEPIDPSGVHPRHSGRRRPSSWM
jgi:hypothetical protein